jgi:hypothetical protein
MQRQKQEKSADAHTTAHPSNSARNRLQRRRIPVLGEVVFGEPDRVVPKRFRYLYLMELFSIKLGEKFTLLGGIPKRHEQPNVHTFLLRITLKTF